MEGNNIIFLGFADNKTPEFVESKTKDWVLYGEDNRFPNHLLMLYNKSSNHNAIINGKVNYIIGNGFAVNPIVNRNGETLNKVIKKLVTDIELFGGCRVECIWKMGGGLEIAHLPFHTVRTSKAEDGFYYKKDWTKNYTNEKPTFIPNFDPNNRKGVQIMAYDEYRPGCDIYPLPGYFGALNDIETDVEISKYNLSVIKNGMFSSKMIVFNNGQPTKEIKSKIEKDFKNKFTGAENSGNFMLVFNDDPAKAPTVQDLSTTDLDKLFDQLNKTTQSEIFSGHQVTSPMLFGIKTEGQLGGRSEIVEAYEIFKNTYINDKQMAIEELVAALKPYLNIADELTLESSSPITEKLDPVQFKDMLPKEWVLEQLGIDPLQYGIAPSAVNPATAPAAQQVNENVKNLTGRQHQQLLRVIKQVGQGKMTRAAAVTLLKSSLALSEDEINGLLGPEKFEAVDDVLMLFNEAGEDKNDYTVIRSMSFREQFKADLSQTDSNIINLIKKDPKVSAETIAEVLDQKPSYIKERISNLEDAGVLKTTTTTIGIDTIIERAIVQETIAEMPKPDTVDIFVKYEYGWRPEVPASQRDSAAHPSRPFCKRLMDLNKVYTRTEIEGISQRLGYSVFDRQGGWWGENPHCRHQWNKIIVVKKRKNGA